jgi:hypothetical protein
MALMLPGAAAEGRSAGALLYRETAASKREACCGDEECAIISSCSPVSKKLCAEVGRTAILCSDERDVVMDPSRVLMCISMGGFPRESASL